MQPFNPHLPWDCHNCEFHNAFCSYACTKCKQTRDLYFMCLKCLQLRPIQHSRDAMLMKTMTCDLCSWNGLGPLYVSSYTSNASSLQLPLSSSPVPAFQGFEPFDQSSSGNSPSTSTKVELKMPSSWSYLPAFAENDIAKGIALSLEDQQKESKDLADWEEKSDQKKWVFEEKHTSPFSSWECTTCGYPNQGSKVIPLGLNDWRQRRLICCSCKTERQGHWRCLKNHLNTVKPVIYSTYPKPPSAHICSQCDEETRTILVEYLDGYFFEKEEEEGWAMMSLKDL